MSDKLTNIDDILNEYQKGMEGQKGVTVITHKDKVSRFEVERYKFSKGKTTRIAILGAFVRVATHYNEGVGSIRCFDGLCCRHCGEAKIRYVAPILVYQSVKDPTTGKTKIAGIDGVYTIVLDAGKLNTLRAIEDENGSFFDYDINVTCDPQKDEKFQDITFVATRVSTWRDPRATKWQDYVRTELKRIGNKMLSSVAKEMTVEQFKERMGISSGSSELDDIDDSVDFDEESLGGADVEDILFDEPKTKNKTKDELVPVEDDDLPF